MGKLFDKIIFRLPGEDKASGLRGAIPQAKRVVFLSATRTPFGAVGGSLKDFSPIDLGALAARAALEQAHLAERPEVIDAAIFGNGMHTSIDSHYGARHVALKSG